MSAQNEKATLYYVYDPICGWCYGFSPVITSLAEAYDDVLEFKAIPGGMILGDRVGPVGEIAPFIKDAYKRVEDMTGVKFGQVYLDDLLNEGLTVMNSWPGSLAATAFNELAPEQSVAYASAIQKAIYADGVSPEDIDHFIQLAVAFEVDTNTLRAMTKDKAWHEKTIENFKLSSDLGVTGFPTLVLEKHGERTIITRGYADQQRIEQQLKAYLALD